MLADALITALQNRDADAFEAALNELGSSIPRLAPDEVARNADVLVAQLEELPVGIGSNITQLLGGMCDHGAAPADVLPGLVDGAIRVLEYVHGFKALCAQSEVELPEQENQEAFPEVMQALLEAAGNELGPYATSQLAEAWFAGDGWIQPLVFLMQRKDVRSMLPRRAELAALVEAAREDLSTAHWLHGLLLVLDDEPVIVLHRATGLGWRCTISGVGDNFQLHTLLAATFAEAVGVEPPTAVELAAATDGELIPGPPIKGNFNLVDAFGKWIWNEGRPADIPPCDGIRVVVLDPPAYARSWNAGRLYPHMASAVLVNAQLTGAEAAQWLAKVAPDAGMSTQFSE